MPISAWCKILLYSDDCALIILGFDPRKIEEEISKELESCRQWIIDKKLSLHFGKSEFFCLDRKVN